jgi:hypothetical protein
MVPLARTAQADNGRNLSLIDLQINAIEDGSGTEALRHILELD